MALGGCSLGINKQQYKLNVSSCGRRVYGKAVHVGWSTSGGGGVPSQHLAIKLCNKIKQKNHT